MRDFILPVESYERLERLVGLEFAASHTPHEVVLEAMRLHPLDNCSCDNPDCRS